MASAFDRSCAVCRFSQNSGPVPKYRPSRSAVSADKSRRSRKMSLMRLPGTPISSASCRALRPRGSKNSSRSTSPGCVRTRGILLASSMVINDLNIFGTGLAPAEANSPLVVNPDAPLAFSFAAQPFKTVSWRQTENFDPYRSIQHIQFSDGDILNAAPISVTYPLMEQPCGLPASKRFYHRSLLSKNLASVPLPSHRSSNQVHQVRQARQVHQFRHLGALEMIVICDTYRISFLEATPAHSGRRL